MEAKIPTLLLSLFAGAASAQATTFFEFDFRNESAGTVNQSASVLGASNPNRTWTVGTNTSVSTGGTAIPGASIPGVATGYLDATASNSQGLSIVGTTDGEWRDYLAAGGQSANQSEPGIGTWTVFFRPAVDLDGVSRASFVSFPTGRNLKSSINLNIESGSPTLRLRDGSVSFSETVINAATFNWETDSWYYMAASWDITAETTNQGPVTIYLRRAYDTIAGTADPDGAAIGFASSGAIDYTGVNFRGADQNFAIGARAEDLADPTRSRISYASWTDDSFTTQADFDAAFLGAIPEPGMFGAFLGVTGLVLAVGLRRRQS